MSGGGKRVKADALLHDYEEGGEFYEPESGGWGKDGAGRYEEGGYGDDEYGYEGGGGDGYYEEDPTQWTQAAAPKGGKGKKSLIQW
jgi:hypothetical protein